MIISSIALQQNIEIHEVKMSAPPVPFANDKYYRSKPTVYGTRNNSKGMSE